MDDTLFDPFLSSSDDLMMKLALIEAMQVGQIPLNENSSRGLSKNLDDKSLRALQEQSLAETSPISTKLGVEYFDLEPMRAAMASIVYAVYELELDQILEPVRLVKGLNDVLPEFLEHTLKGDEEYLISLSETLGVSAGIVKLIGETLIGPPLTRIASMCLKGFLDSWNNLACPVCGRLPTVATKDEGEPWRFKCLLCGADYRMDVFSCPHCRSEEKADKGFLLVGDKQELELAYCEKCKRYYKIINKSKLSEPIPPGLEGIYTGILDQIARDRGLMRIDDHNQSPSD